MADIDYDLLAEKLAEAVVRAMSTDAAAKERAATLDKEDRAKAKAIEETIKLAKAIKETGSTASMFKRILLNQRADYIDVQKALDKLDKEIEKETEALKHMGDAVDDAAASAKQFELQQKIQQRSQEQAEIRLANFKIALSNATLGAIKFTDNLATTTVSAGGQFAKGLLRGSSSIEVSSGLMSAGIDIAKQAAVGGANAMQGFGTAIMAFPHKAFKAIGVGLVGLGSILGYAADKTAQLAKFGVEVLGAELEKTIDAYSKSNLAGALFADGMTGLRNAAHDAGLTLSQFANVLTKHSADLAGLGEGVTGAARRMGAAMTAGGNNMRTQLLNLGYSFEEQAGLVAETMAAMRQSGGKLMASDQEVAQQTVKYAENLRVISAITGEDAQKKSEQVKQQASQLAFQQKLAGMDEKQRIGVINAMKNMSDLERRNFMDMVNFGTVINKEGATAQAMSGGLTSAVSSYYEAFRSGTLDELSARKISAQNAEQQKKDYLGLTDIATAQAAGVGGLAGILGEILGKELAYRNKVNAESIQAGEELAAKQKVTNDKLTGAVNETVSTVQRLQQSLEKELLGSITSYATAVKEMNKLILDAINELKKSQGKPTEISMMDKLVGSLAKAGKEGIVGAGAGALVGAQVGAGGGTMVVPGLGTVAGAGGGAAAGAAMGFLGGAGMSLAEDAISAIAGWFKENTAQHALGGPATPGKVNVFGEKGPEAAVPLIDGREIPVTIKMLGAAATAAPTGDLSNTFFENLTNVLKLIEGNNKSFFDSLTQFGTLTSGAIERISQLVSANKEPMTPNAFEMMQFKDTTVTRNITEYLQPQLDSLALSKNIVSSLGQNLDSSLTEFRSELKKSSDTTKSVVASKDETVKRPEIEIAEFINQLKIANADLKETLVAQNKLLEQNVRTSEQLLSVANDNLSYSQSIAQNTL